MVSSAQTAQVAGYTIVRVLARGPRATLLLAHHDGQSRVLRIAAEGCDDAQLDREIDARARAAPEHAATVLDLATSDAGAPVVVLEHLSGPRLDELLDRRSGGLSAGEAVTLIVPLLEAVAAAHDRGLTLGGLSAAGIRLRSDGAPVITRFSAAQAGAELPAHLRGRDAEYRRDRESALALARAIARHVVTPAGDALVAALEGDAAGELDPSFRATIAALFDCADATPVLTTLDSARADDTAGPEREVSHSGAPDLRSSHVRGLDPRAAHVDDARATSDAGRLGPLMRRLALPDSLASTVLAAEARLAALGATVRNRVALRTVAPRTVALGAAGAASVLLALLLLSAGGSEDDAGAQSSPTASASPPDERYAPPEGAAPARDERSGAPERLRAPEPEQWEDVVGELVERWLGCRERAAVAACAHESTQPGSSAEAALPAPGEDAVLALRGWSEGDRELVVVERMGAAVIVDLVGPETTTASLLLMRSEAGWRLRDVLVEPSRG